MRSITILIMVLVFSSIASASVAGRFTLERLEPDMWRAEYCFDEPVEFLGFERPIENFRETSWRPLLPDYELTFHGGTAQIARRDRAPFRCTGFEIDTYTEVPIKDYMAFSRYSDGGMAVYTGYMTGRVYKDGSWQPHNLRAQYVGLNGETILARDSSVLDHQFVYFGPQEGLKEANMVMVIDPAMPTAAREGIETSLPAASRLLEELFGFKPASPFQVFMTAGELLSSKSAHTKGGSLKHQILFTLKGKRSADWAIGSPHFYPRLAAHEVLHLWQQEVWHGRLGEDAPWVHEGGADAIAHELMARTGVYSKEQYEAVWRSVQTSCANYLSETSVEAARGAGKLDAIYQCGALVNWIVGNALAPRSPGAGMIAFWRTMTTWDEATIRATPSDELYFMTLEKLGFSEVGIKTLRLFLVEKPQNPTKEIVRLWTRLRVR